MSLDYKLTKIKDFHNVCLDNAKNVKPITTAIIFGTMSTGIGEITEKNYVEFYHRYAMVNAGHNLPFTLQDVRNHIGLSTNVFPNEKTSSWYKRIIDNANRSEAWKRRGDQEQSSKTATK